MAAFYKDPYGVVHLSGTVAGGTFGSSDTGTIFELPCGYGPNRDHNFPVASTGVFGDTLGHVEIFWAGCADGTFGAEVRAISGSRDSLSLDGITLRAYGGAGAASATAGVPPHGNNDASRFSRRIDASGPAPIAHRTPERGLIHPTS